MRRHEFITVIGGAAAWPLTNSKTAKALGIEVPPTVLALADEAIE